jgi:polysaccharide export outer membrane protein
LVCLLLLGVLSGCASRGGSGGVAELPQADPVAAAIGRPEYRIGPSDLLKVTVFRVEELDRQVRVSNDGRIVLPLIGPLDVAGRTAAQAEADIAARYAGGYLQAPQVTVFVEEYASQRITVGGAVGKPGIYPITSRLTLLQALSLAEGADDVANLRNVVVFRTIGGNRQFARFDALAISRGDSPDPELMGEDVVVVDTAAGKVALQNLIKLAPFVAVWRAYR